MFNRRGFLSSLAALTTAAVATPRLTPARPGGRELSHVAIDDLDIWYPAWLTRRVTRDDEGVSYQFESDVVSFEIIYSREPQTATEYRRGLARAFRAVGVSEVFTAEGVEPLLLCGRERYSHLLKAKMADDTAVLHEVFELPPSRRGDGRLLVSQKVEIDGLPTDSLYDEMWRALNQRLRCHPA